jgi:hypothetical protein
VGCRRNRWKDFCHPDARPVPVRKRNKNIEIKNIQGLTLIKLSFYENTNMAEASAQIALQVNGHPNFFRRSVACR